MKKVLACLLIVVLLCSLSIMLFSCDSKELKKLEYIDANGEVATVSIKKSEDPDQVTASICALANKPVDTSSINSIMASLSASLNLAGTQNDTAWDANLNASATIGAAIPAYVQDMTPEDFITGLKFYAGINATGKVPQDIMNLMDDEETVDFTKTVDLNESANLYLDENAVYAKIAFSDNMSKLVPMLGLILPTINNKTSKVDLLDDDFLANLIEQKEITKEDIAKLYESLHNANNSYIKIFEGFDEEEEEVVDGTDETEVKEETNDFEFNYANVKKLVEAFNIKVTKTKGSVATFSASIDKNTMKKLNELFPPEEGEEPTFDEEFKGSFSVELSIDAKTMLDVSLSVSSSSIGEFISDPDNGLIVSSGSFTVTASISTAALPTISQEDKDAAKESPMLTMAVKGIIGKILG